MAELINIFKAGGIQMSIAITGGGTQFIPNLLSRGGASSVLLNAEVPYSREAVKHLIGGDPREGYCSSSTARELAMGMHRKALPIEGELWGVGVAASLEYEGQREGRNNIGYIAVYTHEWVAETAIRLFGDRAYQEKVLSDHIALFLGGLADGKYENKKISNLYENNLKISNNKLLVFSGSFNPFHQGHEEVQWAARRKLNCHNLVFEICRKPYGKADLDGIEIRNRINTIPEELGLILITDATLFEDKDEWIRTRFPEVKEIIYVVGDDTFDRAQATNSTYDYFESGLTNSKFFVYPRNQLTLENYKSYKWITPESFLVDPTRVKARNISSTEIRKKRKS